MSRTKTEPFEPFVIEEGHGVRIVAHYHAGAIYIAGESKSVHTDYMGATTERWVEFSLLNNDRDGNVTKMYEGRALDMLAKRESQP